MSITRREFVRSIAASLGAVGSLATEPALAVEENGELLPMVDTHQHLWDLTKLRLPWLKSRAKLRRNFVMKDYLEATRGLNVVQAVYMEVAVAPEDKLAEAEYIIDLCRRTDNPTDTALPVP